MADAMPQRAEQAGRRSTLGRWVRAFGYGVLWISTAFLGAGTLHWTRGWIFAIVYCGSVVAVVCAVHHWNPALMEARLKERHKDTKTFDKVFIVIHFSLTGLMPCVYAF